MYLPVGINWRLHRSCRYGFRRMKFGVSWPSARGDRSATGVPSLAHARLPRMETRVNGEDDSARFRRVVLPHLADAYALARWLTGNRADAEDVVQDACLRAFRGIGSFSDGNARAWVLTIVRHTAYVWLRKCRPAPIVVVADLESVEHEQASSIA